MSGMRLHSNVVDVIFDIENSGKGVKLAELERGSRTLEQIQETPPATDLQAILMKCTSSLDHGQYFSRVARRSFNLSLTSHVAVANN